MMLRKVDLLGASVAALLIAAPVASWAQSFTNIVDPNDTTGDTVATGINDSGQIVGYYNNTTSGGNVGFSLSGGSYSDVVVSGSATTAASGVNNAGLITGSYTDGAGSHGFTWSGYSASGGALSGGTQTPFDVSGAAPGSTFGSATNSAGTTVGYFFDNASAQHGYAGPVTSPTYTPAQLDGPGAAATLATGINSAGTIVGSFFNGSIFQGFEYNGSAYSPVNDPLGLGGTNATGIDDAGDVVGYYIDGGGITHGFIDYASNGQFVTIDDPNSGSGTEVPGTSTQVLGINNLGDIVGAYETASGNTIGFEEDLPEPATASLFVLGLLGIGAVRHRRA